MKLMILIINFKCLKSAVRENNNLLVQIVNKQHISDYIFLYLHNIKNSSPSCMKKSWSLHISHKS